MEAEFGGKHVPGCSPDHNAAINISFDIDVGDSQ
jgi:hypothetical protein